MYFYISPLNFCPWYKMSKKYCVPLPEYTLHLEDIMVKFTPLKHPRILYQALP